MDLKRIHLILSVAALALGMYMLTPGCGNKSSNNAAVPPISGGLPNCIPGQICNIPGAQGVPLLNGPSLSSLDSQGSTLLLNFAAPSLQAGQSYSGPVNIVGTLHLPSGCWSIPPGDYPITGQGMWQ